MNELGLAEFVMDSRVGYIKGSVKDVGLKDWMRLAGLAVTSQFSSVAPDGSSILSVCSLQTVITS